ncbi:hypothetical protein [Helicovermis profundi]|uniref:Uncharacterized protein n=1 Tax=Helicovermis profundi TaxID=3065157 RepID=A0AAU9EC66_9FIRM|nr:hypothetical protein HLPR_04880 [Clostridia bacterium S502]
MSDIIESYNELSKIKTIGVAILLNIILSIVEIILLIHVFSFDVIVKLLGIQMSIVSIVLASKIRKNKHIYIITSFTYEEAKEMTPENRNKIALKIYKTIAVPMTFIFIYSMMGIVFRTSSILDISIIICTLFVMGVFVDISLSKFKK